MINRNPHRSSYRRIRKHLYCFTSIIALIISLASTSSLAQQLERVAVFEQWPGVSQFIGYRNRIWFVNSQPYEDTNVADIYSYSIDTGSVRYERSLFSQDVGDPVVHNGLLYWPFEDPRRSSGSGEYAVTDGTVWQWHTMQSGSVMHVHAMSVCDGELVATTGAWTGQLHRLSSSPASNLEHNIEDKKWELQYDYPAASESFSRLVSVSELNDSCIVGASARRKNEAKLFVIDGDNRIAIDGWPRSDRVDTLIRHQKKLFAFSDLGSERQLISYDGSKVEVVSLPSTHLPRALHSDGNNLWLATHNRGGGDGADAGGGGDKPGSLWKLDKGQVAIGTYSASGGTLWLYREKAPQPFVEHESSTTLATNSKEPELDSALVASLVNELLDIIKDPESTANRARMLRRKLGRHSQLKTPEFGAALTRVLATPIDGPPITMFTGRTIAREDLIRWYLITTLAINGHGRIDPALIRSTGELVVPQSAKLFNPSIAAIVAVGWLEQSDRETLASLMARLNSETDPEWVKADVIGALTALTDQRFGYELAQWNAWWSSQ